MTTTESPAATSAEHGEPPARRIRGRRRRGPSIQSKLLLMLLATSVLSAAVVGFIGFHSGRQSLEAAAMDRLTLIRSAQTRQLRAQLADLHDSLIVYTHGATAVDALQAFTTGFHDLDKAPFNPDQDRALRHFYQGKVADREAAATGGPVDVTPLVPDSPAQRYLQAHYTVPPPDREAALGIDDAGDDSAWTAAHRRYNHFFRTMVTRSKFGDLLLLDPDGNVVYSAYKNVDLGTNVRTGPYRESNLGAAFTATMNARGVDYVGTADFGEYEPAAGEPTAWLLAPVDAGSERIGVLAVEFPITRINQLMTLDAKWETAGLGKTGEVFLVGPDNLMRSNSRVFLEDPEAYKRDVVRAGTPPDVAEKAISQGGTTLVQPAAGKAAKLAAQGQTGDVITRNYLGHRALQSFAPVDLPGLRWTIVAEIDAAEAFAPVAAFTRTLVLSTTAIVFAICLAAMVLARVFVAPIRGLMAGAAKISSGDYDVDLPVLHHDELGDLTAAFNDMARNLTVKEKLIEEQRQENDRLLLSVMPEAAVRRYRAGDEDVAIAHSELTVIAAEIDQLGELSAGLDPDESLSVVNTLIRQFDAAAESAGVETVQTLHDWYLAGCGLSIPRLDSAKRGLDFALELRRIVDRFNQETGNTLQLRIGIDTGPVTSGLIGRSNLAYDMWGATVNFANQLKNHTSQPGIYVTSRVHDSVGDDYRFVSAGSVTRAATDEPIWRLDQP